MLSFIPSFPSGKLMLTVTLALIMAFNGFHAADARGRFQRNFAAITNYNYGVQLMNSQHREEAITAFSQALQIDPSLHMAHGPLGQLLFQSGAYAESIPELLAATNYDNTNAAFWCQLGIAATHTRKYDTARSAFEQYLRIDPYGSYAAEARRSLAILAEAGSNSENDHSNYLAKMGGAIRKWRTNGQPLKVYIADNQYAMDSQAQNHRWVEAAFAQWTELSDGRLRFQQVDNPAQAQINLSWTNNPSLLAAPGELGCTQLRFNGRGDIQHASILLLTPQEFNTNTGDKLRRSYFVALHESGHALGLQHSAHPRDVMSPTVAPAGLEFAPSARDKNTVLALYQ